MTYTIFTPFKLNRTKTLYAFRHRYREARYVCLQCVTVVFCNTHKHTCPTHRTVLIFTDTCLSTGVITLSSNMEARPITPTNLKYKTPVAGS